MRDDVEPIEPADYTRFKFYFLRRDEAGRWHRDASPVFEEPDFDLAYEQFWLDADGANLLYCGALNGDYRDESADWFEFGDQHPDRMDSGGTRRRWFTVFAAWDTGAGWCRNVEHVQGVSAYEAEGIWRRDRDGAGRVMVAAVVEGKRQGIEYPNRLYCTYTGQPSGSPQEQEWAAVHPAPRRSWAARLRHR